MRQFITALSKTSLLKPSTPSTGNDNLSSSAIKIACH
jgi:hypothetical protein